MQDGAGPPEAIVRLDRQIMTLRRGIDRLIDCYAGGYIDKAEFEPRIAGLKLRMSQLQVACRPALVARRRWVPSASSFSYPRRIAGSSPNTLTRRSPSTCGYAQSM